MIKKSEFKSFSEKYNKIKYRRQYKKLNYINRRFSLLFFGIMSSLIVLIIRILFLQIVNSDNLIKKSDARSLRTQKIIAIRGMITDRFGKKLAISVPKYSIWIDPKIINENKENINNEKWRILSKKICISLKKIKNKIFFNKNKRFIYLSRDIDLILGEYIRKLNIKGVFLKKEMKRDYPYGPIVSNLLGVTDIDNQGIEGIEKSFDSFLHGEDGKKITRRNLNGKVVEYISFIDTKVSNNLTLSIDIHVQSMVYKELKLGVKKNKAKSGVAVLLDVKTGEILSMVSIPSYDPNNFNKFKQKVIYNNAITDVFEPGSTVKPMVIIGALKKKIIKNNSIINTRPYFLNGHKIKDVIKHEQLSISGILRKSSNVGVSRLALKLSEKELINIYEKFGIGKPTNLDLIGENNGFFLKKKHFSELEKAIFSFGYGVMVTPLQLARVYATIGSFGVYRPLSIKKVNFNIHGLRVFPEKIVRSVVRMMENIEVLDKNKSDNNVKNYKIAIKTGTVKKVDLKGKYINRYIAYAAGIAPIDKPRYSLVVIINEPSLKQYYAHSVSVPILKVIMNNIFSLKIKT